MDHTVHVKRVDMLYLAAYTEGGRYFGRALLRAFTVFDIAVPIIHDIMGRVRLVIFGGRGTGSVRSIGRILIQIYCIVIWGILPQYSTIVLVDLHVRTPNLLEP